MSSGQHEETEIAKIVDRVVFFVVQNEVKDESARELRCFDPMQCGFQFTLLDDDHRGDGSIPHPHTQVLPRPLP